MTRGHGHVRITVTVDTAASWSEELPVAARDEAQALPDAARVRGRLVRPNDPLSSRELEISGLVAHGLSNTEIARMLFIAPSTVKFHLRGIGTKLATRNRVEIAAWAWQTHVASGTSAWPPHDPVLLSIDQEPDEQAQDRRPPPGGPGPAGVGVAGVLRTSSEARRRDT